MYAAFANLSTLRICGSIKSKEVEEISEDTPLRRIWTACSSTLKYLDIALARDEHYDHGDEARPAVRRCHGLLAMEPLPEAPHPNP